MDTTHKQASSYDCVIEHYFSYMSIKTYVVGAQKNHLDATVLLSTTTHVLTDG